MKILVFAHRLEVGGTKVNAIDWTAANALGIAAFVATVAGTFSCTCSLDAATMRSVGAVVVVVAAAHIVYAMRALVSPSVLLRPLGLLRVGRRAP